MTSKNMVEFYHGIDYYICASWNEGTPNPALEAGACGVPVITTRVGNMPELIQDGVTGFFIEPTLQSIVDNVLIFKTISISKYNELSVNIRQKVCDNWSWEKRIGNYFSALTYFISE